MRRTERRGWPDRVGAEAYAAARGDTGDLAGAHHRSAGVRPVPARGVPRQSWRCEPRYRATEGGAGALPDGDCPRSITRFGSGPALKPTNPHTEYARVGNGGCRPG